MLPPDPSTLAVETDRHRAVEQLGTIDLATLNQYDEKSERKLVSLLGVVYDVTENTKAYGPRGGYRDFAGHDVTLTLGINTLDGQWLDCFYQMKPEWITSAEGWVDYYQQRYPVCGRLSQWDIPTEQWPVCSHEEMEALEAPQCTVS